MLPRKTIARPRSSAAAAGPAIDQHELRRRGHTRVPLLDPALVAAIRPLAEAVVPPDAPPFFASPAQAWGQVATRFHREVAALLAPRLAEVLPGHHPFLVAATVKPAGGGAVKYHQDWTYTDERVVAPTFLWCPLVDVDEGNGVLRVVSGTHRAAAATIRPSRGLQGTHVAEAYDEELDRRSEARPLQAGEALAFHPATFHGSHPNRTDRVRPAITIALVPEGTPLVHFHLDDDGVLSGHRVDDGFFTTNDYGSRPTGRAEVAPWARPTDHRDLQALVARPAPVRRALGRLRELAG